MMYFNNSHPHSTSPRSLSIVSSFCFLNSSPICTVQICLSSSIPLEIDWQSEVRSFKKTTRGSYQLLTTPPLRVECCAHLPSSCWVCSALNINRSCVCYHNLFEYTCAVSLSCLNTACNHLPPRFYNYSAPFSSWRKGAG